MFSHFLVNNITLPAAGLLSYIQMESFLTKARWVKVDYKTLKSSFGISASALSSYVKCLYNAGLIDKAYIKNDDEDDEENKSTRHGANLYVKLEHSPFKIDHEYDYEANMSDDISESLDVELKGEYLERYLTIKKWKDEHGGLEYPREYMDLPEKNKKLVKLKS